MSTKTTISFLAICTLLLLCSACSTSKSSTRKSKPNHDLYLRQYGDTHKGVYHEVRRGETLSRISASYGKSVAELQEANGIANPNHLNVGFLLFIPGATAAVASQTDSNPTVSTNGQKPVISDGRKGPITAEAKFKWPVRGSLLKRFGDKVSGGNPYRGIQIGVRTGTRIAAAKSGKIAWVSEGMAGYGKVVAVSHSDGFITVYGYCSELLVQQNAWVKQGDAIALSGQTGRAKAPSLYFQVSKGSKEIDPEGKLPK